MSYLTDRTQICPNDKLHVTELSCHQRDHQFRGLYYLLLILSILFTVLLTHCLSSSQRIIACLHDIDLRTTTNGPKLNITKTELLIVGSKSALVNETNTFTLLKQTMLPAVSFLGILRRHLTLNSTELLVSDHVTSPTGYCTSIPPGIPNKPLPPPQIRQNSAQRIIPCSKSTRYTYFTGSCCQVN